MLSSDIFARFDPNSDRFSPCIFIKVLSSKFHRMLSDGSRADPCGQDRQTDRQTEGRTDITKQRRFSLLCERAWKLCVLPTRCMSTYAFRTIFTTNNYCST